MLIHKSRMRVNVSRITKLHRVSLITLHWGFAGTGKRLMSESSSVSNAHRPSAWELTGICQPHEENDTSFQTHDVKHEMAQVVGANAVVNPGAVTITLISIAHLLVLGLLTGHVWQHIFHNAGNACYAMAFESCRKHRNSPHRTSTARKVR